MPFFCWPSELSAVYLTVLSTALVTFLSRTTCMSSTLYFCIILSASLLNQEEWKMVYRLSHSTHETTLLKNCIVIICFIIIFSNIHVLNIVPSARGTAINGAQLHNWETDWGSFTTYCKPELFSIPQIFWGTDSPKVGNSVVDETVEWVFLWIIPGSSHMPAPSLMNCWKGKC